MQIYLIHVHGYGNISECAVTPFSPQSFHLIHKKIHSVSTCSFWMEMYKSPLTPGQVETEGTNTAMTQHDQTTSKWNCQVTVTRENDPLPGCTVLSFPWADLALVQLLSQPNHLTKLQWAVECFAKSQVSWDKPMHTRDHNQAARLEGKWCAGGKHEKCHPFGVPPCQLAWVTQTCAKTDNRSSGEMD